MMGDHDCQKQIAFFEMTGMGIFLLSLGLLLAALLVPVKVNLDPTGQDRRLGKMTLSTLDRDELSDLYSRATGRLIIKAAQSQAAVKDNGLAAELAKSLKLQGIVNMPNGLTAYIRNTKTKRTLTVHEGENLDDFIVRKVDEQSVTLDLDGVEVRLSY